MCTATFIPHPTGYCLAMNRDEKPTRQKGMPPTRKTLGDLQVICPSEPGGGTWIALNDQGVSLALLNWHAVPARAQGNAMTRGQIVSSFCAASSVHCLDALLNRLSLAQVNPFRLIGVFPGDLEI